MLNAAYQAHRSSKIRIILKSLSFFISALIEFAVAKEVEVMDSQKWRKIVCTFFYNNRTSICRDGHNHHDSFCAIAKELAVGTKHIKAESIKVGHEYRSS